MPRKHHDRILKRRALFISSALTASLAGCEPSGAGPSQPVVSVQKPPMASTDVPERPPEQPPPKQPEAAMPRIEIPDGISEGRRQRYAELRDKATQARDTFRQVAKLVPQRCDILETGCEQQWRQLAEELWKSKRPMWFIGGPCNDASETVKAYWKQVEVVRKYCAARRREIDRAIQETLEPRGDAAKARWAELQREVSAAHPVPCLSIMCDR